VHTSVTAGEKSIWNSRRSRHGDYC